MGNAKEKGLFFKLIIESEVRNYAAVNMYKVEVVLGLQSCC